MKKINNKPRILMLGPIPPPIGGMAAVMENLIASNLSKKCDVFFINNGKKTRAKRTIFEGVVSQIRLISEIVYAVIKKKIELVHVHTCSGFTFWRDTAHVMMLNLLRCKVILHIHGGFFDKFIFSLGPIRKWLMKQILSSAAALVVLSSEWKDKIRYAAPSANWKVIPNGVKFPPFYKRTHNIVTFLFLGNLGEKKGIYDLLDAFSLFIKRGLIGKLHIAGGEEVSGDFEKIVDYINGLACKEHIDLLGLITGKKKADVLNEADCLILPSHAEGLPMAILEAMASGIPVIATNVGAIPEVIKHGQEGFLFDPKDVNSLSYYLITICKNSDLRRRMGNAARKKIESDFSLDIMIHRILKLYYDILT